jgi:hypothetical protein
MKLAKLMKYTYSILDIRSHTSTGSTTSSLIDLSLLLVDTSTKIELAAKM